MLRRLVHTIGPIAGALALLTSLQAIGADSTTEARKLVSVIAQVAPPTEGFSEARDAASALSKIGPDALVPILEGFRGANPVAQNWLTNAFEEVASAAGEAADTGEWEAFIRDRTQSPAARRLAYEWLIKRDEAAEARLLPDMLNDPGSEFRRDAVARVLTAAEDAAGDEKRMLLRQALNGAVHQDQVSDIAAMLKDEGEAVDIAAHFGFLQSWKLIGPFDNREGIGFAAVYPPETDAFRAEASYPGMQDSVTWQTLTTSNDFGIVNIAEDIENYKGSVMYATTTFDSSTEQDVQVRLGTPNAWKLWINGREIFTREEYHRSTQMDQYRIPVTLKAGANTILLKVCQNEQTQDWAQRYQFQFRISDMTGVGIRSTR